MGQPHPLHVLLPRTQVFLKRNVKKKGLAASFSPLQEHACRLKKINFFFVKQALTLLMALLTL